MNVPFGTTLILLEGSAKGHFYVFFSDILRLLQYPVDDGRRKPKRMYPLTPSWTQRQNGRILKDSIANRLR